MHLNQPLIARITLCAFLLLSLNLSAQRQECVHHLTGLIETELDSLPPVKVRLIQSGRKTMTTDNGSFSFPDLCAKKYIVQVKYKELVLVSDTLLLSSDTTIRYSIKNIPSMRELGPVEITAPAYNQTTSNPEELSIRQIDQSKGLTLGQMLENVNGVRTLKTGSSIAKPIIHGFHSNRVLILNNGIRQEGQQWGAEHAPEIDPFVSNSISIIKGAGSIKYGFDAIGGVVLVEPVALPDSAGTKGELNLVGFSNGRQGVVSGSVSSRLKKYTPLSISLQGTLKRGGNQHTPNYFLKNTGIREYNFSTVVNWDKQKYGARLFYSQFNTDLGIFSGSHIGNLTDLQNAFEQSLPADSSGFSYAIDRPFQHIEHELSKASFYFRTGNSGKLNVVYGRQYNLRYEYDKHKPLSDSLANLNNPELQLELTTHTLDLNWKHYSLGGFRGEIGMNTILQKNTYTGRMFIPNYANEGIGVYWIERKSFGKFLVEGGIRYDTRRLQSYFWQDGEIVSPIRHFCDWAANIGAKYTLSPGQSISFNASKSWRPPTVNELYSDGLHHGAAAIEIGDDQLSAERGVSTNLDYSLNSKNLRLNIHPYFNYFSNYIFLEPELPPRLTIRGAFPTFIFKQAEANIYGVDLHLEVNILKNLEYHISFSTVRGYNLSISDYLIQMPSDNLQNKIHYCLPDFSAFKDSKISLSHSYTAKQIRIPSNTDFAPPPPAYNIFNLMYSTTISTFTPIVVSVGVNNLFDVSYRDYLNRFRYYADELGRNLSLRVKIPIE